jgi:hypothetical protein
VHLQMEGGRLGGGEGWWEPPFLFPDRLRRRQVMLYRLSERAVARMDKQVRPCVCVCVCVCV